MSDDDDFGGGDDFGRQPIQKLQFKRRKRTIPSFQVKDVDNDDDDVDNDDNDAPADHYGDNDSPRGRGASSSSSARREDSFSIKPIRPRRSIASASDGEEMQVSEEEEEEVINVTEAGQHAGASVGELRVPTRFRDVFVESEAVVPVDVMSTSSSNVIMERAIEQLHPHKIPRDHETTCVFCMNMLTRGCGDAPEEEEAEVDDLKLLTLEYYEKLSSANPIALSRMITRKYEKDIRGTKNTSYDTEIEMLDDPAERAALEAKKLPQQLELVTYLHFATTMHQMNAVTINMVELGTLNYIKEILLGRLFVTETVDPLEFEGAAVDTSECVPKVTIDQDIHRMYMATHDRSQGVMTRPNHNSLFNAPRQVERAARKSIGKPLQYTVKNSDKVKKTTTASGSGTSGRGSGGGGSRTSSYTSRITSVTFQPIG